MTVTICSVAGLSLRRSLLQSEDKMSAVHKDDVKRKERDILFWEKRLILGTTFSWDVSRLVSSCACYLQLCVICLIWSKLENIQYCMLLRPQRGTCCEWSGLLRFLISPNLVLYYPQIFREQVIESLILRLVRSFIRQNVFIVIIRHFSFLGEKNTQKSKYTETVKNYVTQQKCKWTDYN